MTVMFHLDNWITQFVLSTGEHERSEAITVIDWDRFGVISADFVLGLV